MSRIAADLEVLPEHVLFDLARNTSVPNVFRKEAVEIMLRHGYKKVFHEDLDQFRTQIEAEIGQLEEIVVEKPAENPSLKASVTTKTMFGVQKTDDIQPADGAKSSEPILTKPKEVTHES